jgi:hypothetical protein
VDEPFVTLFSIRWGWLTASAIIFIVFLLLYLILSLANVHPWTDTSQDRIDWYHHEECEAVKPGNVFVQVFNFWSNFSYFAGGLLVVCLSTSHIGRACGVVFILLSLGSGWFHGTLTEFGQTVDLVGVYAALAALIAYAIVELFAVKDQLWPPEEIGFTGLGLFLGCVALGAVGGVLRLTVGFFNSDYFTPFLVIILVVYMVVLIWRSTNSADLWLPGIGTLVVGLLAMVFKFTDGDKNGLADYGGDYTRCAYTPGGIIQGHALWHLLSGLMFVCMFEYIRSVRGRSRSIFPWRI